MFNTDKNIFQFLPCIFERRRIFDDSFGHVVQNFSKSEGHLPGFTLLFVFFFLSLINKLFFGDQNRTSLVLRLNL